MKARQLLNRKSKWTKNVLARDAAGQKCPPGSQRAVQFCLLGAVAHCYRGSKEREFARLRLRSVVWNTSQHYSVSTFNDSPTTTFTDIKRILKLADV